MTDIQKQLAEASVECLTDESGTDYSVSVRIPGMTRALQSDVWIKGGKKADLLVKWLNDEVIPALAAHRQQEARGPLTWQPIETAPRDGTRIIAWRSHAVYPHIVRWDDAYGEWEDDSTGHHLYHLTYWMPLPPAPDAANGIKGE